MCEYKSLSAGDDEHIVLVLLGKLFNSNFTDLLK